MLALVLKRGLAYVIGKMRFWITINGGSREYQDFPIEKSVY